MIAYFHTIIAIAENFICRGGKLLGELASALLSNNELCQGLSMLCDYTDNSEFSFDDTTPSFQFFLWVFGCVRAKDIANKYNSKLYKGKNDTALRAGLAAVSG